MSYAIIGFGNIGRALANAFARNGIEGVVTLSAVLHYEAANALRGE